MSIRIMTQVWDIDLPDSQKIVLLALADCANDEGTAWPSMRSLTRKCSKGERTVQGVIQRLVESGHLTREERVGRSCVYHIHPRKDCAPAEIAPRRDCAPQPLHPTPAAAAPHPRSRCGQSVKEPSRTVRGAPASVSENRSGKVCITEDWTPPPVSELPAKVQALVSTWPSGAYQAVCETFRLHYLAEDRQRTPAQWLARLGAWLTADHAKVLRDAKAGVSFAALAPVQAGTAVAKRPPTAPPACKDDEDERSGAVHAALQASEGEANWRAWLQPCAILISGGDTQPSVTVVTTSDFLRDAVQSRFEQAIRTAARTAFGKAPGWVRFDAQRPATIARTGTDG